MCASIAGSISVRGSSTKQNHLRERTHGNRSLAWGVTGEQTDARSRPTQLTRHALSASLDLYLNLSTRASAQPQSVNGDPEMTLTVRTALEPGSRQAEP